VQYYSAVLIQPNTYWQHFFFGKKKFLRAFKNCLTAFINANV